jgi:hypothetical protein
MDSTLDFLNSLSGNAEAAESVGFVQHPLGTFHGVVESVTQKSHNGSPLWELKIATSIDGGKPVGHAQFSIWGFSQAEVDDARRTEAGKKKILDSIARIKRHFVDLEIYTAEQVKSMIWSNATNGDLCILGSFKLFQGRKCSIAIKPNNKDASKQVTFLNAPQAFVSGIASQGYSPQASNSPTPPSGTLVPPGSEFSLESIPF